MREQHPLELEVVIISGWCCYEPDALQRRRLTIPKNVRGGYGLPSRITEFAASGFLLFDHVCTFSGMLSASMLLLATVYFDQLVTDKQRTRKRWEPAIRGLQICVVDDTHVNSRIVIVLEADARSLRARSPAISPVNTQAGLRYGSDPPSRTSYCMPDVSVIPEDRSSLFTRVLKFLTAT